jgi:hypothetical protein
MIRDYIDISLSNNIYDRVIVTGMDKSGKSTMMTPLLSKFNYIKCCKLSTENMTPSEMANCYKIFDRHAITDNHIYNNLDSDIDLDSIHQVIKYYIDRYYKNTLFIIYLHDKFLYTTENEPDYVYKYRDVIKYRFVRLANFLINNGYPVIKVKENSVRGFNLK